MSGGERMWGMDPTARSQENLRRLALIDGGFVEDQARLGLALDTTLALDPKTAALLQVGASVAAGSPGVYLEWSTTQAAADPRDLPDQDRLRCIREAPQAAPAARRHHLWEAMTVLADRR